MIELKHQGWVSDARFVPWGGKLITADVAGVVRVWNLERGEVDREIVVEGEAHAYAVRRVAAAMSPDRRHLALAATSESRVRIYDLAAGEWMHELEVNKPVHDLAYTAEGALLVGTYNGGLQMFTSTEPGTTPRHVGSKTAKVMDLHVSACGVICLRYGYRLWRSFDLAGDMPEQAHRQFDSAATSDAAVIFADKKSVHIRRRRRHRKRVRVRGLRAVAVSKRNVFAAAEGALLTFDLEGESVEETPADFGDSTSLAISADGRHMVHWVTFEPHRNGSNIVRLVDRGGASEQAQPEPQVEEEMPAWEPPSQSVPITLEPESNEMAAVRIGEHEISVDRDGIIAVRGTRHRDELGFEPTRVSCMATPQGRLLAHIDGTIELREVPTLTLLQRVRVNSRRTRIAHHGKYVAVLQPNGFRFTDPRDLGRVVCTALVDDSSDSILVDFAITADDRIVYARRNGEVGIIELSGGLSNGAHVAPVIYPTILLRLSREVSRFELSEDGGRTRIGVAYRDGSTQTSTLTLPRAKRPAPDIGTMVSQPLHTPLGDAARDQIARLGGAIGEVEPRREATYPDGVFPLPKAVQDIFSVRWSEDATLCSMDPKQWNGIVSSAPTLRDLDFSVRGVAPLIGRVRARTLQQIRLICIAASADGLLTIDMGSDPSDPIVYLVDEKTGERNRLLPISQFLARIGHALDDDISGVRQIRRKVLERTG